MEFNFLDYHYAGDAISIKYLKEQIDEKLKDKPNMIKEYRNCLTEFYQKILVSNS